MPETALLLEGFAESAEGACLATVLDFFGVSWRASTVAEALSGEGTGIQRGKARLFCSADALLEWAGQLQHNGEDLWRWRERIHSAFVCGSDDFSLLRQLVRLLIDAPDAELRNVRPGTFEVSKAEGVAEFCSVMSGVRCETSSTAPVWALDCKPQSCRECVPIVKVGDDAAFFSVDFQGVPVFVSTAPVVDLHQRVTRRRFDVREYFLTAVPVALYVRWAFPRSAWRAPDVNACLVIDDPLLKPRYGFLDYEEFLGVMEREAFTTTIAFIPWNWRRSDPRVVGLVDASRGRYSLCVHGCDHTAAEFGTSDTTRLVSKIELAVNRMERHRQLTGLRHDPVMVFPQGVFSRAALRALKHYGFVGAVNTGVISVDAAPEPVTVADVWDTAVLNYDGFPIFTRRYPSEGLANFAFDVLLGKPCLVVIHHEDLHDNAAGLVDLVQGLNGLKCRLSWRSLGEVVMRSCRHRETAPCHVEVKMYGSELLLQVPAGEGVSCTLTKEEPEVSCIDLVTLNSRVLEWTPSPDGIRADFEWPSGEPASIRVAYKEEPAGPAAESLRAKIGAGARRFASEIRDNYVTPARYSYRSCVARLRGLRGRA